MNLLALTKQCQLFMQDHDDILTIDHKTLVHNYTQLVQCLIEHNHKYYIETTSVISDHEYDQMFAYLKKLEEYYPDIISQDSPTQALVGQLVEGFEKAEHKTKLLSLENSYNEHDLEDFFLSIERNLTKEQISEKEKKLSQHEDIYYYLEPKFDGISIELIYQDGVLIKGITRGDGYVGDDVTNNVKQIENLPHKLKYKIMGNLRLRAEILMPKSKWKNLNKRREEEGLKIFANPRNAVAGTMKLLDSSEVRERGLLCYVYDILETPVRIKIANHKQMYKELEKLGLPIYKKRERLNAYKRSPKENNNYKKQNKINSIKESSIVKICLSESTISHFDEQDIDFDGIVIKINDYNQRSIIGETDHHPKRAIAYKFPATQAATQIKKVEFQIGRTGIATPVAYLTPTKLSGVTISRASLHNIDYINQKDIRLNDRVRIQRSGEVIPYIVGVIADRRDPNNKKIKTPTHCPSCNTELKAKEVYVYCPNHHHCLAQIKEQICHFVSKQCMNIDGLGEKLVQLLIEQQLINSIADIYDLPSKERILRSIPGFGKKRIEELIKQIKNSQKNELRRLLNGLGLPGIGKKMAKELQKNLSLQDQNLDNKKLIKKLQNKEFLESIYGIGETITESLQARTHDSYNITLLNKLYIQGVSFNNFGSKQTTNLILSGLHFSITGTFEHSRPQIIEQLESYGAILDAIPTIKTNFILIGENPGSKEKKAEQYKIKRYKSLQELKHDHTGINILEEGKKNNNRGPKQESLF